MKTNFKRKKSRKKLRETDTMSIQKINFLYLIHCYLASSMENGHEDCDFPLKLYLSHPQKHR